MRQKLFAILFSLVMFCCIALVAAPAMAKDYLYVPCDNSLDIIDMDTDTIIKSVKYNDYIVGARMSPDGSRYYLNAWRRIFVIDTDKNELIDTINLWSDLNRVYVMPCFDVSNDGKKLYLSVSITKKKLNIPRLNVLPPQLVVFDIATKKIEKSWEIPPCATGILSIRNDPNHIFVVDQDVHKLDLRNGKLEKLMGILRPIGNAPALNSLVIWDNRAVGDHGIFVNPAYTAEDLYYMVFDRNKGTVRLLKGEEAVFEYSVLLSPDKKYIYGGMDEVYKIDFKTGKTLAMDPIRQGTCYSFALNSAGTKLYCGPAGADISVYDTATMKRIGVIYLNGNGLVAHRLTK